ncbi:glycine zipper family protein [Vibrio variabilis]|uniref:glycine zipper family protein n=1 Tax=Vibrio variabilis TaxID=990271 RepID=UPI000DDB9E14|nr:glycine zipper family protein [Vibrio variabilis]
MKKLCVAVTVMMFPFLSMAEEQVRGGDIIDPQSKLIFNYQNVTKDVAESELAHCQNLAHQTHEDVQSSKGSGVKGLLKGAAAGAAVGAISGGSGSDAAKVGAAGGLLVGRLAGKGGESAQNQQNLENYKVVLRNCMTQRKYVALN